ncbi:MAG TPA: FAD-dependent thymidylate synthase [Geminicoccus sp.]|uniref:FAD-dependent thymidylate synthase n=1 Tax=Geminicoccus sp. TaxID=2024832 RepID=UPI002E2FFE6B|nr:FAD-dependent thymidylate synthase [Geminicoccus sp.]HEX2524802.1 FAD-dependent thymidylate synthase [Geminicoccus sp.]
MRLNESQAAEIDELRTADQAPTRRAVVPALEEILFQPLPVLDQGFIRVVDYMGDDAGVVQAARVSYGKGTRKVSDDRGLIRYLMRHRHTSPFEMCEIKLHVKLPIFIARQWIRHRTAAVNEYSARYSVLDDDFYVPETGAVAVQSHDNRQGRGAAFSPEEAQAVQRTIREAGEEAFARYHRLLNEDGSGQPADPDKAGVARELARVVLPLSTYSQWYWKIDLHNLLHFVALRLDTHAQAEIRAYAEVLAAILQRWVPLTWEAFQDYRLNALELSGPAVELLKRMLAGEKVTVDESGLSPREWRELVHSLGV